MLDHVAPDEQNSGCRDNLGPNVRDIRAKPGFQGFNVGFCCRRLGHGLVEDLREGFGLFPREPAIGFEFTGSQHFIEKDHGHAFSLAAKLYRSNLFAGSLRENGRKRKKAVAFLKKSDTKKLLS